MVLDLVAGIGYFSVPYLLHAKVKFLVACEWNPHAIQALKYNLNNNKIAATRYQVIKGDSRQLLTLHPHVKSLGVTRVNLGLIPSSREHWEVGLMCLQSGGVMHIHMNVHVDQVKEMEADILSSLKSIRPECLYKVVHVEKVKSYAPKVDHLVFDVVVDVV